MSYGKLNDNKEERKFGALKSGLTEEERMLANHFMKYQNASQAYQYAYPEESEKYDAKRCSERGLYILKKKHVRDYINKRNRPIGDIVEDFSKDLVLDEDMSKEERLGGLRILKDLAQSNSSQNAVEKFWNISYNVNARVRKVIPKEEYYKLVKRDA